MQWFVVTRERDALNAKVHVPIDANLKELGNGE